MNNHRTRSRFAFLHVAALATALIGATAYADPAPPEPAGTPPAATATAPTATNPGPVTPPAQIAPAPGARREETEGQEQPPAPAAPTGGLFDRAIAFMQPKDGLAAKIAGLESESGRLEAELAESERNHCRAEH